MTVSAKVRKSLPASRMGKPGSDEYPMPDKRHARIAKGFAAMHHDPDKAAIDAKADKILARARGGKIFGESHRPSLGRAGRQMGGAAREEWEPKGWSEEKRGGGMFPFGGKSAEEWEPQQSPGIQGYVPRRQTGPDLKRLDSPNEGSTDLKTGGRAGRGG